MLKSLSIENYKSFGLQQEIEFAQPSEKTSGLTVFVGPNNTGKSTILSVLRRLFDGTEIFKAADQERRGNLPVGANATFLSVQNPNVPTGTELRLMLNSTANKTYYQKRAVYEGPDEVLDAKVTQDQNARSYLRLKPIHCRRPWRDGFSTNRNTEGYASTAEDQFLTEEVGSTTPHLSQALYALEVQGGKTEFNQLLQSILPEIHDWTVSCPVDTDYICYVTPSGKEHRISLSGEGIINVFRIAFTLMHLEPGEVMLIDEPEVSLHPQAQKRLASVLLDKSRQSQIIVATHSPYFVNWSAMSEGSKIWRQSLDHTGDTFCGTISDETLKAIKGVVDGDIKNRRLYDVVAKEIFFADSVTFTEGPEDVHFIENYLRNGEELPLFGYGSGGYGNLPHFLKMADELGIRAAALFDGDKEVEFEAALDLCNKLSNVTAFKLFKDDIRDKEAETIQIQKKEGVFQRNGDIHAPNEAMFKMLLDSIRVHLTGSIEEEIPEKDPADTDH